jgi:tetratricopeptide (TPR) repeat protein
MNFQKPNQNLLILNLLLVLLVSIESPSWALTSNLSEDITSSAFLKVDASARIKSLGGTQPALRNQLDSIYSNPASLASLSIPELFLSHQRSFLENNYETVAFGLPFQKNFFGVSLQYFDEGKIDFVEIDSSQQPIDNGESFRPYSAVGQLTWAYKINPKFSFGLSGKSWVEQIKNTSQNGWAIDGGLQIIEIGKNLDLGLSFKNAGPSIEGFNLPLTLSAGGSLDISNKNIPLTLFLSYNKAKNDYFMPVGLELKKKWLALRGSYQISNSRNFDELNKFSLGAGIRYKSWNFDYAWKASQELGDNHLFSVGIGFGLTIEEKERASKIIDNAMQKRIETKSLTYIELAQKALKNKDWDKAINDYSHALAWDPTNENAQKELMRAQVEKQRLEADNHYKEALAFIKENRWIDATLELKLAVKLEPENLHAQALLEKANLKSKTIQSKNESSTNNLQQLFLRGTEHYVNGNFDLALKDWEFIQKQAPSWPSIQEYLAKAKLKSLEKKLSFRLQNKSNDTQISETLMQNAYTYYSLGQLDEAIQTLKKVLILNPSNDEAGKVLKEIMERKNLSEGLDSPQQKKVQELNAKAFNEYSGGRLNQALKYWKQALSFDPGNLRIKNNIQRVKTELNLSENLE